MVETREFNNNALTIQWKRDGNAVELIWLGRSNEREPAKFLSPILNEAIDAAGEQELVLNFRSLDYMNSSTITPLLRLLNRAKLMKCKIKLIYRKSLRWQELSFSALQVFKTADGKVQIVGQ